MKIRNSFKKWNARFAILLEGKLVYFKSKTDVQREICAGIVLLQSCLVKQRPSKKAGFCIKIFSVYQRTIFSRQDLRGKPLRKVIPAATDYCLIRLTTDELGKEWLLALQQAIPDYDECKKLASASSSDNPADSVSSSYETEGNSSNEENFPNQGLATTGSAPILQVPNENPYPGTYSDDVQNVPITIAAANVLIPTATTQIQQGSSDNVSSIITGTTISNTVTTPPISQNALGPNSGTISAATNVNLLSVNNKESAIPTTPKQSEVRVSRNTGTGITVPPNTELREIKEELKFQHEQLNKLKASLSRAIDTNSASREFLQAQEKNLLNTFSQELSRTEKKITDQVSRSEAKLAFAVRSAMTTSRANEDPHHKDVNIIIPVLGITTRDLVAFLLGVLLLWVLRLLF